jgi:quercetin dioxygenase-like cupin family protein
MDHFLKLEGITEKEIIKGFHAKFIHTENMTIAYWRVEKGSSLPIHSHIHEQVTNVLEGEFEMTVDNKTTICRKGEIVKIPSNIEHGGKALTDCFILDVFQPTREDYR